MNYIKRGKGMHILDPLTFYTVKALCTIRALTDVPVCD